MNLADRNQRVEQWLPLVAHVVNRLWNEIPSVRCLGAKADLRQIGSLGLIRAVELYDASRGVAFKTYAYRCIRQRIVNDIGNGGLIHIPRNQWDAVVCGSASQDDTAVVVAARKVKVSDCCKKFAARGDSRNRALDRRLDVLAVVSKLPKRSRMVVRWFYGLDGRKPQTLREIAQRYGVSQQSVWNWLATARCELKALMEPLVEC